MVSRQKAILEQDDMPDELLFGRVGYLYSLLFVQHHIGPQALEADVVDEVRSLNILYVTLCFNKYTVGLLFILVLFFV